MKINTVVLLLVLLLCLSGPANATLIDRGTGMIYDTVLGITWLQDANYAQTSGYDAEGRMSWDDAMLWSDNLVYGGLDDWRLPDGDDVNGAEMGHMYFNNLSGSSLSPSPFINIQQNYYWSRNEYPWNSEFAYLFNFQDSRPNHAYIFSNKTSEVYAWAVRDGDYGPSVTTTQTYLTNYLTLGDTFTFDHWWDIGIEPTEFNFDVLFFNGENWETLGWELNFGGSSEQWETSTFWVPPWAQGETTRIMFSLFDGGQQTDPTVYLRNIGSSSAPVPEPATIFLMGLGLVGLVGLRKKN